MPREDHGSYTQYVQSYTSGVTLPQFRGMYFPADGGVVFKDINGNSQYLQNVRGGDYVPICGIEITSAFPNAPILLY